MTARSDGEVTLQDLRPIGLTKGPTYWRTVRVQRMTTNDSERQRTTANDSGLFTCRVRSSAPRELIGGPPVPATDYWHPLTFVVVRCRSLYYSPAPSPG